MPKHDKTLAKQVEEFMRRIPSQELRQFVTTQALVGEWLKLNEHVGLVSQCLKSRFGSGDGNPALRAFQAGKLSRCVYDFVMAVVDCWESLFNLLQSGWEYLKQELPLVLEGLVESLPKNELELYEVILREVYDNHFKDCLGQHKVTLVDLEQSCKLAKNAIKDSRLSSTTTIAPKLEALISQGSDNLWYSLAVGICIEKAKSDRPLARVLNDHFDKSSTMYLSLEQAARYARKHRDYSQIRSVKWENGQLYEGAKGGWKPALYTT